MATFRAQKGVPVLCNGKQIRLKTVMADIHEYETDFLQIGDITFIFLERGDRHLIRVWNKQSETRKSFKGFKQYPVNPDYRIEAKYTSYDEPKMLRIQDVIEIHHEVPYQGNVAFDLDGEECCLEATGGEDYLFFSFKNQTTSETTFV